MPWDMQSRWNDQGWCEEMRLERERETAPASVDRIPRVSSLGTRGPLKG